MLNKGDVCAVLIECPTAASTIDKTFTVQADGVLLSLFVESTVGTVEVHDQMRVEVITSDAAKYDIRAKGVDAGVSSVKIEGAGQADNYGIVADTTARLLIPVALVDQNDISIINNNPAGGQILWIGFKASITSGSVATPGVKDPDAATPIPPGSSLGLNVTAGLTVYGLTSAGTCDIRVIQLGG
jgi:hypothetical protein